MTSETRQCKSCSANFVIEPDDFAFYEKMQVPPPTWCPTCRFKRRNVWRLERKLYRRPCDLCRQTFLFMYPEGTPFPVYCRECWLSDKWDPKTYGRDYDLHKPFFQQWKELFNVVPRVGVVKQGQSVNSEYTNRATDMRNCYLVYATTVAENSRYSVFINNSKEVFDCYSAFDSEQCYECIDCVKCFNVQYAQESQECRDSMFLFNCRNVSNCFGCVNIRNGSYMMYNEQLSEDEYKKRVSEVLAKGRPGIEEVLSRVQDLRKRNIVPSMVTNRSEASSGNWIDNAKNVRNSFNVKEVQDAAYCQNVFNAKDCMDYSQWGAGSELIYESVSCGMQCGRNKFVNESWSQLMDSEYCTNCHNSQYLFGCNGLRNVQYCILNKQYSKEEFDALRTKIIEHMNSAPYRDGHGREYSYGEFFPEELSPFPYNESIVQEYFPVNKEEAQQRGHVWQDQEKRDYKITIPAGSVPPTIAWVGDTITNETIECEHKGTCNQLCTTAFRVREEDVQFLRSRNLPLPTLCPNCRHFERTKRRTPLELWERSCQCAGAMSDAGKGGEQFTNTAAQHKTHAPDQHCAATFKTSYAPDTDSIVYCIDCYLAEVV